MGEGLLGILNLCARLSLCAVRAGASEDSEMSGPGPTLRAHKLSEEAITTVMFRTKAPKGFSVCRG